jgi:hypothetical protein
MKDELLILFVILLLGLILSSFLGGNGNIEGMENSYFSKIFYGENGASAQFQKDTNGNYRLFIRTSNGTTATYTKSETSNNTYTGQDGAIATIYDSNDTVIKVRDKNENIVLILSTNPNTGNVSTTTQNGTTTSYDNYNHYDGTSYPSVFYGPYGATAKIIQTPNNNSIVITKKNGSTEIYYIDTNSTNASTSIYYGQNGGSAKMIYSNGNKAVEITTLDGSKIVYSGNNVNNNVNNNDSQDNTINQYDSQNNTTGTDVSASTYYGPHGSQSTTLTGPSGNTYSSYDSSAYYNSQSNGISRSQIPSGDEDLYILKSQIIPPVCPKCPSVIQNCPDNFDATKCPACPACARCPEPNFSCKKVPNYNAFNPNIMPVPVLTDFSGFGM